MKTSVQKELTNKGIKPTLYDPRVKERKRLDIRGVQVMQKELESIHPLIGFSHVIPKKPELLTNIDTRYGPVVIGSPLSFHLSSLEFNFTVVTNLEPAVNPAQADSSDIYKVSLPFHFPDLPEAVHFSTVQQTFIEHLRVTHQESIDIEKRTVKQRECDEWIKHRKNRLGSSVCHRIYVRKRSFNNLAKELNQPFKPLDEIPAIQQRKLKHGIKFEPVAREKYYDVMKHYLKRPITLRETGMVIPPCMFWLEGSPDGLVIDPCSSSGKIGTIEMKCPEGKKNHTPEEAMQDESFYIELVDGEPNLKNDHHLGYYTQVQLVMGFCGLEWVDFVVYLFKGMIITRVPFNKDYFDQVVCKVNIFYVKWFLPQVMA